MAKKKKAEKEEEEKAAEVEETKQAEVEAAKKIEPENPTEIPESDTAEEAAETENKVSDAPVYIFPGSIHQSKHFSDQHQIDPKRIHVISTPDDANGLGDVEVICCGTYFNHSLRYEIFRQIKAGGGSTIDEYDYMARKAESK